MHRVTITEVAEAAGVSAKSVSRVINREPNVREKLRAKVQAAIDELGFVPNAAARSLAAGRAFVIGTVFDNPSPNYTLKIQQGAYAACQRHGYQLVIEHLDTTSDVIDRAVYSMLRNNRLDAMIITPPVTDCEAVLDALEANKVFYVRLAPSNFEGRSPLVRIDDAAAAALAVGHLWDLGHKDIAMISGPPSHGAAARRTDGFISALVARGIDPVKISQTRGDFTFHSGISAGLELLRRSPRPSAIFAANDDMAAGVYAAAAQLGYRIPIDLSVVGFDDSWIAQSVWPNLTTIHQPIAEMAEAAVESLILHRRDKAPAAVQLDFTLVVRGSTSLVPA